MLSALQIFQLSELQDIPPVYEWSGEYGVEVNGHDVYLAYCSISHGQPILVFGMLTAEGVFQTSVLDTEESVYGLLSGSPSIVNLEGVLYIMFCQGAQTYRMSSSDYGLTWQRETEWTPFRNANDHLPQMLRTEQGIGMFNVRHDPFGYGYESFVDTFSTMNNTVVSYSADDMMGGIVRSNSDIYIKRGGSTSYTSWPIFNAPVVTTGSIISLSGAYPADDIFLNGLYENAEPLKADVEYMMGFTRSHWQNIGESDNPNLIYMLTVNGNHATVFKGQIISRNTTTDVYSSYPPPVGEPIFTNRYLTADTLWVQEPDILIHNGLHVHNTLWLKGDFSGNIGISCDSDIYLIRDIKLAGTQLGDSPMVEPVNNADRITLITSKQIIIKYGFKDPVTNTRHHPNCGTDAGGIFIYADMISPNSNSSNPRKDGMFTFEYQHPHPSMEAREIDGQLYDKIDLHRFRYPQTEGNLWPSSLDYPWYNPLWPEKTPYRRRGTIHLWGSITQNRMGYTNRALHDPSYPPTNLWDVDNDHCGSSVYDSYTDPSTGISYSSVNFPGATGTGVGYFKNYHYDYRTNPPSKLNLAFGLGIRRTFYDASGQYSFEEAIYTEEPVLKKSFDFNSGSYLYHLNNTLYKDNVSLNQPAADSWHLKEAKLLSNQESLQLWQLAANPLATIQLVKVHHGLDIVTPVHQQIYPSSMNSINRIDADYVFTSMNQSGIFEFVHINNTGSIEEVQQWNPQVLDFSSVSFYSNKASIAIKKGVQDSIYVLIWFRNAEDQVPKLYLARGEIQTTEINNDTMTPVAHHVLCYPNPFRERISFEVQNSKGLRSMAIYNLRGQEIKAFKAHSLASNHTIQWDGTDAYGNQVATGIYLLKSIGDTTVRTQKILKIK